MSKFVTFVSWDDVPHLSQDQKETILGGIPPWQRDSRSKGIPQLGVGAIYTVPESEFIIDPVPLAAHWPRCYALDVGWKMNAALFAAIDKDSNTVYVYDEIYKGKSEPAIIASAIRSRGEWINGVIDPASRGRSQKDGTALLSIYRDLGLLVYPAVNQVEAGLTKVWEMLSQGQLKIFSTCLNFRKEYILYRRDKNGNVVKLNDHLMDALRYLVMSGLDRAELEPNRDPFKKKWYDWQPKYDIWIG